MGPMIDSSSVRACCGIVRYVALLLVRRLVCRLVYGRRRVAVCWAAVAWSPDAQDVSWQLTHAERIGGRRCCHRHQRLLLLAAARVPAQP